MENKASMTSMMSAFGRAYHNAHARDPIFRDTMAGELMTDAEYRAIGGYILSGIDFFAPDKKGTFRDDDDALRYLVHTQIAPTPLARAAWCEDALRTAVHTGVRQYVILVRDWTPLPIGSRISARSIRYLRWIIRKRRRTSESD